MLAMQNIVIEKSKNFLQKIQSLSIKITEYRNNKIYVLNYLRY